MRFAALGLGVGMCVILWLGCGGSESGTSSSSGGTTDSGPDTSSPADSSNSDTGNITDAKWDGFIDAPEVDLTYGTCPTFDACGGDEKGSWKVSGGCLSDDLLKDAKNACPGLTTSNEVIKAKGTVDADGTNLVRHTQVKVTAKAFIPFTGQCGMLGTDCSVVAFGAKAQLGFDTVDCVSADGGGGCDCTIGDTIIDNSTGTYTKNGNTITTDGGDTFDYCVAGSKLTYTQTNGQNPIPLYVELGK
jgi:hypothetical protein